MLGTLELSKPIVFVVEFEPANIPKNSVPFAADS
jgi:hypothetical protein